jgi:small subunit ribosomal protein S11
VGLQRAEVMVKGAGSGRDAALLAIAKSGVRLSCIRDVTPMPHNGCRPPKKDVCKKMKPLSREIKDSMIK